MTRSRLAYTRATRWSMWAKRRTTRPHATGRREPLPRRPFAPHRRLPRHPPSCPAVEQGAETTHAPLTEPLELLIKLLLDRLADRKFGAKDYKRRQSGFSGSTKGRNKRASAVATAERRASFFG